MRPLAARAVSMTPQALALMTAVTPPDWAYSTFLGLAIAFPLFIDGGNTQSLRRCSPPTFPYNETGAAACTAARHKREDESAQRREQFLADRLDAAHAF